MIMVGASLAQDAARSTLDLMKAMVIPQSDIVFAVGKAAPKSDADLAAVLQSTSRLTGAAKTLATQAPAANGAGWLRFSQAMGDAAARAGAAARSKTVDVVLDAGDALYETCAGCHKLYMKK